MARRGSLLLLLLAHTATTVPAVSAESGGSQLGETLRAGAAAASAAAAQLWSSAQPHAEVLLEKGAALAHVALEKGTVLAESALAAAQAALAQAEAAAAGVPVLVQARELAAGWLQAVLAALNDFFEALGAPSPLSWIRVAWSGCLDWLTQAPHWHSLAVTLAALYLAHYLGGSGASKNAKAARKPPPPGPPPHILRARSAVLALADSNARAADTLGKLSGSASSLKAVLASLPAGDKVTPEAAKEAAALKQQSKKMLESIRADLSALEAALGRVSAVCN